MSSRYYLLQCPVRRYDWGNRQAGGTIARFLAAGGQTVTAEQPLAELWMGDHPSAPALLLPDRLPLDQAIAEQPDHFLGPRLAGKRERKLPFLFKILDAARPLSIQAHPDRKLATRLHHEDPEHYPDSNHKPELAIALERVEALVGFRPPAQITAFLESFPEFYELCSSDSDDPLPAPGNHEPTGQKGALWIRRHFAALMKAVPDRIAYSAKRHLKRITALRQKGEATAENIWFERLQELYGSTDPGIFSLYFLNLVVLEREEGVFLPTNEPHAYLNGPILEIMAASDNVVRAGLTGKYRDVQTLLQMLQYQGGPPAVIRPRRGDEWTATYETPAREFVVHRLLPTDQSRELPGADLPSILILLEGEIELAFDRQAHPEITLSGGTILLLPGDLFARGIAPRIKGRTESLLYRATVHPDY